MNNLTESISIVSGIAGLAVMTWNSWKSAFVQGLFRRPTWRAVEIMVEKIHADMVADEYSPEVIVGVGRGGAIAAALISNQFSSAGRTIPIVVLSVDHSRKDEPLFEYCEPRKDLRKILVVTATFNRGITTERVIQKLRDCGATNIQTACLVRYTDAAFKVDYFGRSRTKRQQFPWMKKPTTFGDGRDRDDAEKSKRDSP